MYAARGRARSALRVGTATLMPQHVHARRVCTLSVPSAMYPEAARIAKIDHGRGSHSRRWFS